MNLHFASLNVLLLVVTVAGSSEAEKQPVAKRTTIVKAEDSINKELTLPAEIKAKKLSVQKKQNSRRVLNSRPKNGTGTKNLSDFIEGSCEAVKLCCPGRIDGCVTPDFCYCDEFCMENADCCKDYTEYCQGKFRCWEVDPVNGNPCNTIDSAATCSDSADDLTTIQCNCSPGYVFSSTSKTCVLVGCSPSCQDSEICENGKCIPHCKPGYIYSNDACVKDPCYEADLADSNPCNNQGDIGASCSFYSSKMYYCLCSEGRIFNGITCVDSCNHVDGIDGNPCNNRGDIQGKCISENPAPNYSCVCSKGWSFVDGICQDLMQDPCQLNDLQDSNPCNNLGDPSAACYAYKDKSGYFCSCSSGWIFNDGSCNGACALADKKDGNPCNNDGDACGKCNVFGKDYACECSPGFQPHNGKCIDINECVKPHVCGDCGTCHNTPGGYFCSCGDGYEVSSDGKSCDSTLGGWIGLLTSGGLKG